MVQTPLFPGKRMAMTSRGRPSNAISFSRTWMSMEVLMEVVTSLLLALMV